MYSILPAVVSLLFLALGLYVLKSRGKSETSMTFFLVCGMTFFWQFTWAILFYVRDPALGLALAKFGYLFILFLPTSLYHFVTKLTGRRAEWPQVRMSYCLAIVLALLLVGSDGIVAGVYGYFFGYYPQAGKLHGLHLLQTVAVMLRALQLLYRQYQLAVAAERNRLRYCLLSMLIYFLAAVDYLCNYGVPLYPPGVLFIGLSLGLIAQAIARHNLLANSMAAAATIAHEIRTPLATIRGQVRGLARSLPELISGYRHAVAHNEFAPTIDGHRLDYLAELARHIETEVNRSNFIVDLMLASAAAESLSTHGFGRHSIKKCVDDALSRYPFDPSVRAKVHVRAAQDFSFYGSDVLLIHVLYNLFKNALHAIAVAGKGTVEIAYYADGAGNRLMISDTGPGIPAHVLPHVFDPFYTTGQLGAGSGMGLAFCQRVVTAFGAKIACESHEGRYTRFTLEFPAVRGEVERAA